MKIEILGSLDYKNLNNVLNEENYNSDELTEDIKKLEIERRCQIVSTAGRLSRSEGNVFDVVQISENNSFEKNLKFIKRVIGMGHDSITDHDYLVFAIQDVSPVIEQIIIAERYCSFTIKSRREVDFSNVGFYIPDFHDEDGNILENNDKIKEEYKTYMKSLFSRYSELEQSGIPKEDARFVLPYCFYSNIIMGIDAHTLRDMIIKFTKEKYSNISEVKEFGEKLLEIAKEQVPYIVDLIEKADENKHDLVEEYLDSKISLIEKKYEILEKVKLLRVTNEIDNSILAAAIMRRYQLNQEEADKLIEKLSMEDKEFKKNLMRKIAFDGDKLELTQVNFEFQIPISYAVLTHLTRHRTHHIMVPDFVPNINLEKYKIPPKISANFECLEKYKETHQNNKKMYEHFKNDYLVREEDLVYFVLSGNMVNVITNMDGKTVKHILGLRECTKAQWETRDMANGIHREIDTLKDATLFSSILGPTCVTQGFCKEGKESCGRINSIKL